MNMREDKFHHWVDCALKEVGTDIKNDEGYRKFRAIMQNFYTTDRMKKFLKVGEYEEEKWVR